MAHVEILVALVAFFGLVAAWFAAPTTRRPVAARPAAAREETPARELVGTAA